MKDLKNTTSNSSVYRKALRREQKCSFCPPNRGENANRKARPDRHKNKSRKSIRG